MMQSLIPGPEEVAISSTSSNSIQHASDSSAISIKSTGLIENAV